MIVYTQANRALIGKFWRSMWERPQSRGAFLGRKQHYGLALGLFLLLTMPRPSPAQQLQPSAVQQIEALLAEKASRTPAQRKISSHLLFALKRQRRDPLLQALPLLRSTVTVDQDGKVEVDIRAEVSDPLLADIRTLGGEVLSAISRYDTIRARLPLHQLETLAARSEVRSIRPAEQFMNNIINTSEGVVAHQADTARTTYGVDGSSVTVGVLSDGVDSLAALQASGDLPSVSILAGQAGSGSEGTAMLEIVHDLAPGATLLFATAFGGQAQFAQNILDLRTAGADIIVDDIFYFAEATFQDGIVADAVAQVTAGGAFYFSSAGNSGNLNDGTSGVWEGDFSNSSTDPSALAGFNTHDFSGGTTLDTITDDPPALITLQWADPLGISGNDYDLYLLNAAGDTIVDAGEDIQDGNDDPFEAIDSGPPFNDTGLTLAVVQFSGADRFLNLNTHRGQLSIATAGQTSGHSTAIDGFGVAAVDVACANTNGLPGIFDPGDNCQVETFSSDGPRRIFFEADGTPITPGDFSSTGGEVRDKPDIAAADGVMTATPGFNPFFGTSAAAPHAAGIAALVAELSNLTPSGIAEVFAATALDIEATGVDRDSGSGIIDAVRAVGTTTPNSTPCVANHLSLSGIPNVGTQTFRACETITAGDGLFNDLTLIAGNGIPGTVTFQLGFTSDGPLTVDITSGP